MNRLDNEKIVLKNELVKAVENLDVQINALQEKKDLLLSVDETKPITLSTWKKLLKTPLNRNEKALLALLQGTFPGASIGEYTRFGCEGYIIYWNGIDITLPNTYQDIYIDMNWYYVSLSNEKTIALVEKVLPTLEAFAEGSANILQWKVRSPFEDKNKTDFSEIKKEYEESKNQKEQFGFEII